MFFSKSNPFITALLVQICMLYFTIFTVYAGDSSHVLGTVGYQTAEEGVPLSLEFIPPEGMEVDDVVLHFLKLRALFHQRAEWTI